MERVLFFDPESEGFLRPNGMCSPQYSRTDSTRFPMGDGLLDSIYHETQYATNGRVRSVDQPPNNSIGTKKMNKKYFGDDEQTAKYVRDCYDS